MAKYAYLVAVATSALLIAAPMVPAEAATASVLTIGKTGGTAVSKGAVLTASLASKTNATFSIGKTTVKCASASFTGLVTSNPAASGNAMAKESVTAATLAKCVVKGVKSITVTAAKNPATATVSAAKGNPVTVKPTSKSKPITLTATITVTGKKPFKCTYTAASLSGKASNTGNTVSFSKQKFTFSTGTSSLCSSVGKTAIFSATYGPVKDTTVKGSPKVFVN